MTTLTDKLDAMVKVAREATPGPWRRGPYGGVFPMGDGPLILRTDGRAGYARNWAANEAHAAQSHPTVFAALCEVARAADEYRLIPVRPSTLQDRLDAGERLDAALTALERALEADRG